eukprot:gb/GECG01007481.1/.p1 GENE.gb/GECG01007481.1/~~gb/GECG01007481.1/.p1  ORF type:complete len:127 (+),score=5.73 gb/GECG01007481.1/:1-381(+)
MVAQFKRAVNADSLWYRLSCLRIPSEPAQKIPQHACSSVGRQTRNIENSLLNPAYHGIGYINLVIKTQVQDLIDAVNSIEISSGIQKRESHEYSLGGQPAFSPLRITFFPVSILLLLTQQLTSASI